MFELISPYSPTGDQPTAIKSLMDGYLSGRNQQTLLGVTGSGKTFTMANIIKGLGKKTLILAHNKTLAAQLYAEFKDFFPNNAVEYFVSYYDYYQPEAYIPGSDTYIEKDSAINDEIDKLRHSATRSLLERDDVIVVSSVSCIYGIGSPDEYNAQKVFLEVDQEVDRDQFLAKLVSMQYLRNDIDFSRGTFRVRGDVVDVYPAYEDSEVVRIEFFGDQIESLSLVDPLRNQVRQKISRVTIYPKSHYVVGEEKLKVAIQTIREELRHRLVELEQNKKLLEKQRLEQRTLYDLEMLEEMGHCSGIENYSRHMTGMTPGEPPPTLIDFFKRDFLMIIDESHMTIPQVGGMYRGDRSRKETLVEHGFRLPSALDNRPLNFQEFEKKLNQVLYVSATPGDYELNQCHGEYVEQVIRPTGLLDPPIEVRSAENQVDDVLDEVRKVISQQHRVLVTTLTRKLAEELTEYFVKQGVKTRYLHADVETIERMEIIRDLRLGVFDVLVGINLLREGLDIPETALVAILDADKEGFLRSTRSLIQMIGRAARNDQGKVIMYAYKNTKSMEKAISETNRRRAIQLKHNQDFGITPVSISKKVTGGVIDTLRGAKIKNKRGKGPMVQMSEQDIEQHLIQLKVSMKEAVKELRFEDAAKLRDEIRSFSDARLFL